MSGEDWWRKSTYRQRVTLMRQMGFGDVQVYASYRWSDFAPHSRAEIDSIISVRMKHKVSDAEPGSP